jgi:NADH pyrophosphatase NudC (nudix superfamily)
MIDAEEVQGLDDISGETIESEVERRPSVVAAAVASKVDPDHAPATTQPLGEGVEEARAEAVRMKEEEIRAVAAPVQYAEWAGRHRKSSSAGRPVAAVGRGIARRLQSIDAHGRNAIVRLNSTSKSS